MHFTVLELFYLYRSWNCLLLLSITLKPLFVRKIQKFKIDHGTTTTMYNIRSIRRLGYVNFDRIRTYLLFDVIYFVKKFKLNREYDASMWWWILFSRYVSFRFFLQYNRIRNNQKVNFKWASFIGVLFKTQ